MKEQKEARAIRRDQADLLGTPITIPETNSESAAQQPEQEALLISGVEARWPL